VKNCKEYLTEEIRDWLLEESNPSIRYFTLINLLGKKGNSKEVIEAKKKIMVTDPVKKILSHQNKDGSFLTEAMKKKSTVIDYRFGYQPKYRGTIWQLLFLAQLGADENDKRIKNLCKYILKTNYLPKHQLIGLKFKGGGMFKTTIPCYVSNMVWGLSKFGFNNDYRVQNSIKWLLKYQRFDDGDFKTPKEWPYRGRNDRCFSKHSCYIGCTQALKAMTVISESDRTKEINDFIQKAINFVLLHKIYKKNHGKARPIRKEYETLVFPSVYFDDVLQIINSLLIFKVKDESIDNAIQIILEKRQASGKWLLERTIRPSAMYAKFEEKGTESKWITFRVLNVLKKYNEINSNVV
jgi:hypothetical protein